MPAAGKIKFQSKTDPPMSFVCWLGADSPKVTDGYGGWEVISRPRRIGLTQWNGRSPFVMEVSIVIDGFSNTDVVEAECRVLEKMALPQEKEPPVIEVDSDFFPHPNVDWVIQGIDWGPAIRRTVNGKRTRQEATITLIRYSPFDKAQLSSAKRARKKKKRR